MEKKAQLFDSNPQWVQSHSAKYESAHIGMIKECSLGKVSKEHSLETVQTV
jgi:hypothetical protein